LAAPGGRILKLLMEMTMSRKGTLPLCVLALLGAMVAQAEDWKPVDPAELALKEPKVEKGADAEAIFWEVRVTDEANENYVQAVHRHYLRVKIFTAQGKEAHGKVDLHYGRRVLITDIQGRTIRPDGQILDLKKDDIHERVVYKRRRGYEVNAKSFALPGVEPGAIVEYRWKETYQDQLTSYTSLLVQREIPAWTVRFNIKPFAHFLFPYPMRAETFGAPNPTWSKGDHGYATTSFDNVPAFKEEPHMPPENEVRAWMLVYYSENKEQTPEQFWRDIGREVHKAYKDEMKPHPELAAAAEKAMAGATTNAEKLSRLLQFCRTNIKNVHDDVSRVKEEETKSAGKNRGPRDTLERGVGTSWQIEMLFGALAASAGFEVRVARAPDRSDIIFDPSLKHPYFLRSYLIAVRDGETWRLYEPSSRYAASGMLRWQNEGSKVLIADPKEPVFIDSPMTSPDKSLARRIGRFKLAEDGTLEGNVRLEYSGHAAYSRKERYDGLSRERREEEIRNIAKENHGKAELTNIELDNVTDPERPLTVTYHVRVPEYAERTGKRLFVKPAYFQKGREAMFPSPTRRHAVIFDYPWSEHDDVQIEVPAGYQLDHADAPQGIAVGTVAAYTVDLKFAPATRTLLYERKLSFGGEGKIAFVTKQYPALKKVFDTVHTGDGHMLTLKAEAGAPAASAK
jgi:hypothetical protein